VSATHLPGEDLAVTVHGRPECFPLRDPAGEELRRAMLDEYLPRQGPAFEDWLGHVDALGARIEPGKCSPSIWTDGPLHPNLSVSFRLRSSDGLTAAIAAA
jgi:hypothetical protein